jgi:hypothetical protein
MGAFFKGFADAYVSAKTVFGATLEIDESLAGDRHAYDRRQAAAGGDRFDGF